ncbi:hypothetical protein [Bacillus haynesii]|uniref:hypothetical protein n=1 Tax=Bacillus haynesii TaxID=1925021 RepID=UPI001EFBD489|nr:hypothetical protein [Bacillus haynesii]
MRKFVTFLAAFTLLFTLSMNSVSVANAEESKSLGTIKKMNNSELELTFYHSEVVMNSNGDVTVIDSITGKKETLPSRTVDKNDNPVDLEYEKNDNGLLVKVIKRKAAICSEHNQLQNVYLEHLGELLQAQVQGD